MLKQAGNNNATTDARSRCGKIYQKKNMMVSDTTLRMLNPSRRQMELRERKKYGEDSNQSQSIKREQEFE